VHVRPLHLLFGSLAAVGSMQVVAGESGGGDPFQAVMSALGITASRYSTGDPHFSPLVARRTDAGWRVSYCPDNTCEIIKAPSAANAQDLADFTFLYLYYASGYVYLEDFCLKGGKLNAAMILESHKDHCSATGEFGKASCVLGKLARRTGVSLSFGRKDLGQYGEQAEDIQEALAERSISSVKKWQMDQWKPD